MLSPGLVLSGRYRLEKHLATGGMSEVWRATDTTLGRTVAVKILLPNLLSDAGFTARFRAEATTLASLRHPNVVDIYDSGEDELPGGRRVLYLVMEFVAGEPLSRRIARVGRLRPDETLSLIAQAAEALHAAHRKGIVHRDVKPSNLLITPKGTVKLLDFGVARSMAISSVTGTNAVVGTALYMAPEQARGQPVSAATDVYALGAVAYHCLAGRPPFPGSNPVEVALRHLNDVPEPLPADVPSSVAAVVERALAKDPAERYPDAATLAADIRTLLAGRRIRLSPAASIGGDTTRTRTLTAVDHRPVTSRRPRATGRRVAAALAGGVVAVVGLAGALAITPHADAPTERAPAPAPATTEPTRKLSEPVSGRGTSTPVGGQAGMSAPPTRSPSTSPSPTPTRTTRPSTPRPTTPPPSTPASSSPAQPTTSPPPPPTAETSNPADPTTPPEGSPELVPIGNTAGAGSSADR